MKTVSASVMRELDRRTIEEYGTPGEQLMDRAGRGLAAIIRRYARLWNIPQPTIILLAGSGNNGGDAFVAARYLHKAGWSVEPLLACDPARIKGDALIHFNRMKACGIEPAIFEASRQLDMGPCILVDGLLGTGTRGAPRGIIAEAVNWINRQAARHFVVAIDIPTGLDADNGIPNQPTTCADLTVTMALPKQGLIQAEAREQVGTIEVVDIGIPSEFIDNIPGTTDVPELLAATDIRPMLVRRKRQSHKGTYGHVLLLGGSPGMSGAITMAAAAALRSGVGLVTLLATEDILPLIAPAVPEAMVIPLPMDDDQRLAAFCSHMATHADSYSAIMAGPGMGTGTIVQTLTTWLWGRAIPLVLDADALNSMASAPDQLPPRPQPLILTPHPGELARLLHCPTSEIQSHRIAGAREASDRWHCTTVLKGAGTLIASPGETTRINLTGNPGMACGGSGDVLAGLMAGLLAQGLTPHATACAAVFLHGKAGDIAAGRKSQTAMTAMDIISALPEAFQFIHPR